MTGKTVHEHFSPDDRSAASDIHRHDHQTDWEELMGELRSANGPDRASGRERERQAKARAEAEETKGGRSSEEGSATFVCPLRVEEREREKSTKGAQREKRQRGSGEGSEEIAW